jgi:hypothetical protein
MIAEPHTSPSPLPMGGVPIERKRMSKLEREVAKLKEVGVTHTLFLVHDSEFAVNNNTSPYQIMPLGVMPSNE